MRTIALFGFAPETRHLIHNVKDDTEIWSVNWAYKKEYNPPRIDRLFDVHLPELLRSEKIHDYKVHWEWLQMEHDFPIYMTEQMSEVPASVAYPVDELSDDIFQHLIRGPHDDRDDYWVSGLSYGFGMAIHEKVDRIELIGVEMSKDTDVAYQRDGMALLAGLAMGRGIDVWRPEETTFLRAKRYGFEASQMISRASLAEHLGHYKIDLELIQANLNNVNGKVQDRERVYKAEKNNRVRKKDAKILLDNAIKKRNELSESMQMTIGAIQAIEHLIKVADLQEPELGLISEMGTTPAEEIDAR